MRTGRGGLVHRPKYQTVADLRGNKEMWNVQKVKRKNWQRKVHRPKQNIKLLHIYVEKNVKRPCKTPHKLPEIGKCPQSSSGWGVIRLAQLAGRPHKLTWPRIRSSKRVCWDSRDIRDKNDVNRVSWGKKGQFLASNVRSASWVNSYEAVFPDH